jgi:hypothetical protein
MNAQAQVLLKPAHYTVDCFDSMQEYVAVANQGGIERVLV